MFFWLLTPLGKLTRGGGGGVVAGTMVTGISSDVARSNAISEKECGGRGRDEKLC